MIGTILQFLLLWFLASIPLGLIVGQLLARAAEVSDTKPVAFSKNGGTNPAQQSIGD